MSDRSVVVSAVARSRLAAASVAFATSLAGCEGCSDGTKAPKSDPSATTASSSPDAGAKLSRHRVHDASAPEYKPGCRLVSDESPRSDTTRWVSAPGLTVRVLETGREWRLQGEDLLPCVTIGNVEVTLVARGNGENLAGGEGAGAEAWLATPCAAVRAMGAAHRITAKNDACTLHVSGGTLLAWIAPDVQAEAEAGAPDAGAAGVWHRLDPRTDYTWRFDPKKPNPAVESCEAAAAGMERVAAAMAKGSLGQAAADAAIVRASVRAACAIARTRVRLARSPAADAGEDPLDKRIDAAIARGLGAGSRPPFDAGPPR